MIDGITAIFVICIVAVIAIVATRMVDLVVEVLPEQAAIIQPARDALTAFDAFLTFGLFVLLAGSAISGYFVRSHPALSILGFMFLVVAVVFSPLVANMFLSFIEMSEFASYAVDFPILVFIFTNLPIISLASMVILGIFSFAKNDTTETGYA